MEPKGFLLKTIRHGGRDYRYAVYVPFGHDARPWPVILFLHGAGECGTDGIKQLAVGLPPAIMLNAAEWPFLVLIPQKQERSERWADYDGVLLAMLETLEREYRVDTDRVYLTGLSQGGYGTWAIGAKHPDRFAALAPVCGGGDPAAARALTDIPLWAFHGDEDTAVPVARSTEMVEAVTAAGGSPKLTVYPGVGHNSWDNAYRKEGLAAWFREHTRIHK